MNILITGATGLIGAELVSSFHAAREQVFSLARGHRASQDGSWWDPVAGKIELSSLPPLDAIVHLAGESVSGRWTREKMRRIRESRVHGTHVLCAALERLPRPPKI